MAGPRIDVISRAARVQPFPSSSDAYSVCASTGALTGTGVTAGGTLFSFRNASVSKFVVIEKIVYNAVVTTAFTAAQRLGVDLVKATGWTANDSLQTEVTEVSKVKTSMGSSIVGTSDAHVRVAATSIITVGTRTLDTNPIAVSQFWTGGVGTVQGDTTLSDSTSSEQHGLWLAQNEGLVIRNLVVFPAAGVLQATFRVEWRETTEYPS